MSGGTRLRSLAPGQHSFEEMSKRWRAVGDTVSDLTDPGIEPQTSHTDSNVSTTDLNQVFSSTRTTLQFMFHSCTPANIS